VPQYGELDDHHIIPRKWGEEQGLTATVDSILNRTPLTAETNRKIIRNRMPHEYLHDLIDQSGERTVRATLESHFVSRTAFDILLREPLTMDGVEAFLLERQRTIHNAIEELLVKERLDLPSVLRELDAKVEEVELALRKAVASALDNDVSMLPSHVNQKVDERIQAAIRKNSAIDVDYYQSLAGRLEYIDLREIEATIVNKALWGRCQRRFGSKENLTTRFNQLAELRNGIRHSRTVDEVTRKDGEAAILWFEGILRR
jgi:hypothetical protein